MTYYTVDIHAKRRVIHAKRRVIHAKRRVINQFKPYGIRVCDFLK